MTPNMMDVVQTVGVEMQCSRDRVGCCANEIAATLRPS